MYFDILVLPEIHCLPNESFQINNYTIFQNNRPPGPRATHGSGGVAIALHNSLLNSHSIISIVKGVDGQLAIQLENNFNNFKIGILALYLSPDNYHYGRDPETFFNEAAVLYEDLTGCDLLVGTGDVNCRTKQLIEYIPDIDGNLIPPRQNPDQTKNSHANSFIHFLKDNRSIILNGRITPELNNYTFVNPRGCSVPDYMFCPIDHMAFCKQMKTWLMSDIVNTFKIQPPNQLPDHSILVGKFLTSFYNQGLSQNSSTEFPQNFPEHQTPTVQPKRKPKVNLNKMPNDFFMTEEVHQQVRDTISRIQTNIYDQSKINELWSEIKQLFENELNKLPILPSSNNKKQNRKFKKSQPFSNIDLDNAWMGACQCEKQYTSFKVVLNSDHHHKNFLRQQFKNAQNNFDKQFRLAKRKYKKDQFFNLEQNARTNPTEM